MEASNDAWHPPKELGHHSHLGWGASNVKGAVPEIAGLVIQLAAQHKGRHGKGSVPSAKFHQLL
jgi:hypothetical protein